MANLISVRLNKGDASSWGFRLQGGKDFGTPLVVQKISGGSPAERAGLIAGDTVVRINNVDVYNLRHKDAQDVILRAGPSFEIAVQRGGSTWKPSVIPVGSLPSPRTAAPISNVSPITATSLTAGRQDSIGAIGTSHNLSAKPFSVGQVNGGPRLVNKQYNSPLPLYSEQSIAETLSAQTEVLSNGVLGVNFKKNEKGYDSANSAVFRMVQEADKEPRDYESVTRSDFYATHSHAVGGRSSTHRRSTPTGDQSHFIDSQGTGLLQPEPDQTPINADNQQMTKCTDCERVIVGVFVRIKDKNLHVECFKCSTCGTSLKNVGYYNFNNKLYCDVHAKLAARNNPPAPNLQPITVPPGGKIPVGTISAALSSHSLPSPAPLSPNINYSAAPYQPGASFSGPRPFSSVNAPLSPSSTLPKLSPTPVSAAPLAEIRGVQNIVWPPIQKEPELPTASPLYFPPPSQVHLPQRDFEQIDDQEYCELEEMDYIAQESDRTMSLCSAELFNITGRRSTVECSETISDTIDAQILVESIMETKSKSPQTKPKPPPPVGQQSPSPADVNVTFTISEAQLKQGAYVNTLANSSVCETRSTDTKSCSLKETKQSQCLASMYEKKIKVENTVPQRWESPMLVALTVASDKPYSQSLSETSSTEHHEITLDDTFSQIPTKRSTSALASALSVAPSEPFTPVTSASLEPIPLPTETVPYFPPEHPIVIEPRSKEATPNVGTSSGSTAEVPIKKKPKSKDELFKDLPTPPLEKISMLAALTTAPERPYSPFTMDAVAYPTEAFEEGKSEATSSSKLIQTKQKSNATLNESSISKSCLKKDVTQVSTHPHKLYSSFTGQATSHETETLKKDLRASTKSSASELVKKKQESKQLLDVHSLDKVSESVSKNVESTENITNISSGMPPYIQLIRSSFETKTDKVQMEMSCEFPGKPVMQQQIIKKTSSKTDELAEQTHQKSISEKKAISQTSQKEIEKTQSQCQKDLKTISSAKKGFVSSISDVQGIDISNISESGLLQKATSQTEAMVQSKQSSMQSEEAISNFKTVNKDTQFQRKYIDVQPAALKVPPKERITVIQPGQTNLNVPEIAFQPVTEDVPPSTTFSPRPRPITPSMINKPAPVIPAYQASLVAVQCRPAETNMFDPTSPATSRSPSPYLGRSSSPFPSRSHPERAVSPAPGPPQNPLQSHKSAAQIIQEGKMQQARSHLQSFIPQHQSKVGTSNLVSHQAQNISDISQKSISVCNSAQQNLNALSVSQKSKQQQLHEMANMKSESVETSTDSSIQIQRKKKISEEYEHTQKTVQIEKCSSGVQCHSSQKTNVPVLENQAVVGFHVTNPQPLKSPFISANNGPTDQSVAASLSNISQKVSQADSNKKPVAPTAIPKLIKLPATSSGSAPISTASSSNLNLNRSNISQPNTGTGGGRQAGAIGVAPKRGRGILNLAATPGSRVPLCAQCHSNIRGPFITALGKIWCPDHFICATPSCRRALHDLGFVEERGQLYCEYCFEQYLAPPCSKCSSKVKGDCLKAIGKNYHPECFNCVYCGKLFGNSPFFLEDGQPYCEADWNELFTTKCFACGFPVEAGDRWVEALNNNYHSQCFNCTMCKKNLEGQSFFAKGGRPFCKNHAR